ncbi:MAG: hypothetical protein ACL93V_06995 [Candidatus Electrothrix sp. YB6]
MNHQENNELSRKIESLTKERDRLQKIINAEKKGAFLLANLWVIISLGPSLSKSLRSWYDGWKKDKLSAQHNIDIVAAVITSTLSTITF